MRTRILGTSGLSVSAVCLGCMDFGTRIGRDDSFALLDAYYEAGGRFLDTANNYAFWNSGGRGGESESVLGEWMRLRNNRAELIIASKCGALPREPGAGFEAAEGLGAAAIARAAEQSLRHLGIECIDLYYAHIEDRAVSHAETLNAFEKLRAQGKIREIGCSNYSAWRIEEARQISRIEGHSSYQAVQQRFSYLQPRPAADFGLQKIVSHEMRDYLNYRQDLTLVAYSVLLGGAYSGKPLPEHYDTPGNAIRLKAVKDCAMQLGATPNQIVLGWMMEDVPNAIPLIAASTVSRLKENIGSLDLTLSKSILAVLRDAQSAS